MNKHSQLGVLLIKLEQKLVNADLWQVAAIDPKALQSSQPFHHDKLSSQQWLQFIFIARLEQMVKLMMALPASCDITPYIAESLKEHKDVNKITNITKQIDELLSN